MFGFTKGNIGIYVSQNGVPNINLLERKWFIDTFMNTFRGMQVILLYRVIVMDIIICEKLFTYHPGKKAFVEFEHE